MAVKILDLRHNGERMIFKDTGRDEIRYSEAFWQSVRLQPTMESRLVSSDIMQRIAKKSGASKQGSSKDPSRSEIVDVRINELFVRARTLDQMERFQRLCRLAEARVEDRKLLHKHREERIKKEQVSRGLAAKPVRYEDTVKEKSEMQRKIGEAYSIEEMFNDIDAFERKKIEGRASTALTDEGEVVIKKKNKIEETDIIVMVSALAERLEQENDQADGQASYNLQINRTNQTFC